MLGKLSKQAAVDCLAAKGKKEPWMKNVDVGSFRGHEVRLWKLFSVKQRFLCLLCRCRFFFSYGCGFKETMNYYFIINILFYFIFSHTILELGVIQWMVSGERFMMAKRRYFIHCSRYLWISLPQGLVMAFCLVDFWKGMGQICGGQV